LTFKFYGNAFRSSRKTGHTRVTTLALLLLALGSAIMVSCKMNVKADPQVVAAFVAADNAFEAARTAQMAGQDTSGALQPTVHNLMTALAPRVSKYPNPQQASALKDIIMELGELEAHANNLRYNATSADFQSIYQEWMAIRTKLRPYVGKVADAQPTRTK
jgi:hypothetical protein